VVIIEVSVPRRWLRKSKAGLWYCVEDVPPPRFRSRIGFDQVSKSPVEDTDPQPLRIAFVPLLKNPSCILLPFARESPERDRKRGEARRASLTGRNSTP
jgi:hypothetical protein